MALTDANPIPHAGRAIKWSLWGAQLALAALFGAAGVVKSTQPIADLAQSMGWVADAPAELVRFIGLAEVAGALGLILPALTRILPTLTPLAAGGLLVIQLLAIPLHVSRGELGVLPLNVVLTLLAAFVVWGRLIRAPIAPR